MPLDLMTIPCRTDNYAFLIHDPATGQTALFDAPEAAPIEAALDARGWRLTDILLTHHHDDHIAGTDALRDRFAARVIGGADDVLRLPRLDCAVAGGDRITVCGAEVRVIDVPGHTLGHLAYDVADAGAVFTGDSLMALGCGRLFEGTPAQMWTSLMKLRALPAARLVCSGHEYTAANLRFALTIDPDNPALILRAEEIALARAAGKPTVPSDLEVERRTNPFLRADDPTIKAAIDMANADDIDVFAEIRGRKDRF